MDGKYGVEYGGNFTQLPPEVRHCNDLTPMARILYSEIAALTNFKGYCWATNIYLAELYKTDERTIRTWISKLVEFKFINVEYINTDKGTRRKITLNYTVRGEDGNTRGVKNSTEGGEDGNTRGGRMETPSLIDNTEKINTIINNCNSTSENRSAATSNSRLVKKKSLPIKNETVRPVLSDEDGNFLPDHNPIKNFVISEKILNCFAYWNEKPELVTHQINLVEPTKTVKVAIKYLKKFFDGSLVDIAILPNDFDDRDWDKGKHTFDDFKYFVNELCHCLENPKLLPQAHVRVTILNFLFGDERTGIPSYLFTYCVGNYRTALENKYPKTVELIKQHWRETIGKFEDNADNENAFVLVSNLINKTFTDRRRETKGWIPAMGSYMPITILKNILAKNMWIKDKKHSPEYMSTKFFKRMIQRYDYDPGTGKVTF